MEKLKRVERIAKQLNAATEQLEKAIESIPDFTDLDLLAKQLDEVAEVEVNASADMGDPGVYPNLNDSATHP